jgi:hypothetical protein
LLALGFAAAAALFWKLRIIDPAVGADPATTFAGDLSFYVHPMAHFARESLLAGTLPLWNPYQYAGHPFHATALSGLFYPPNIVYLWLPIPLAIEASVQLHLFFAGWFMYLYGRTIALSRPASLASGIVYMGSGAVVTQALWFTPALAACVWLPLGLAASDRLCSRREPGWLLLLALAIALPALSGWFQVAAYSGYAIGFYTALRMAAEASRRNRRAHLPFAAAAVAGGVALGVCLAAIQWIPSWELQGLSPRGPGSAVSQGFSLAAPATLSDAVNARPGSQHWVYAGILPLLLAPLSLLVREQRKRLAALCFLAVIGLGVVLAVHTPFFAWFQWLPGLAWFRSPQRIAFVYSFAIAALAGIGFEALFTHPRIPRARLGAGVASALVVVLAVALDAPARALAYLAAALAGLWGAVLVPRRRAHLAIAVALLGLLSWDLFFATRNAEFRPYHDPSVYDGEADLIDFLRQHQGFDRTYMRVSSWRNPAVMHKRGTLSQVFSITDYEPLSLARYEAFYRLLGDPLLPQFTFVGRLLTEPAQPHFPLIDLLSVRFLVLHVGNHARAADLEAQGWQRVFQSPASNWLIYENPEPLPRAYVAHTARHAPGADGALALLSGRRGDFHREVVLEGASADALASASETGRPITPARIASYQPTRVVVEVDSPEPGTLVLTDTFYPGWRATVDGEPREILRANHLFRGVELDGGRHTVIFQYAPGSFQLGAAVSLVAMIGGVVWWLRRRLLQRNEAQSP